MPTDMQSIEKMLEMCHESGKLLAFVTTFGVFILRKNTDRTEAEDDLLTRLTLAQIAIRKLYPNITNEDIRGLADQMLGVQAELEPEKETV